MIIKLQSNQTTAKIQTMGAELTSFKDTHGNEYMWQQDEAYWAKCSPLLFPIVGNLRNDTTIIDGEKFTIPKHGFCREQEFTIVSQTETSVALNFTFNEKTLVMYPYKFSLTLTYVLSDETLEMTYTVLNLGDKEMDYCIGAHPAFNVPMDEGTFEDYCLEFNKNEPDGCTCYDCDNLCFDPTKKINLTNGLNCLPLKYSDFDNDAFVFDTIQSNCVKLKNSNTGHGIAVDLSGFESIAFWTPTKKDAPFICIEPWNGMAVRSDEGGLFKEKFGVKHLSNNETHSYKLTISTLD